MEPQNIIEHENEQYMTYTRFAEEAGVTRQTIYNREKTDLAIYCKTIDGTKYISKDALSLFDMDSSKKNVSRSKIDENLDSQNRQLPLHTELTNALKAQVLDLQSERDDLKKQVAEKDAQIAALTEQITAFTQQFADMLRDQQEITKAAQTLHAMQQLPAPDQEEEPERRGWFGRKKKKSRD